MAAPYRITRPSTLMVDVETVKKAKKKTVARKSATRRKTRKKAATKQGTRKKGAKKLKR